MKRKKTSKLLFGITILILVSSCTNNNNDSKIKYYSSFRKTLKLKGTHVGPVDYFLEPRKMVLLDSLIVVSDFKTKKLFHVVSSSNYKLKKSFGNKGEGPGECQGPGLSKRLYNSHLVVTDRFITKIYDLDSIISVRPQSQCLIQNVRVRGLRSL